jgi:hypothetical protein
VSDPYSRLYHKMADEYPDIFDGPMLADYVRLLIAADQSHPTKAKWASHTTRRVLDRLVLSGLIVVDGARYSVKGLDKERAARSEHARLAATSRHARSDAPGTAPSNAPGNAHGTAQSMPSKEEKSRDETSRENAPDEDALRSLAEELTGQSYAIPHFEGGLGAKARQQLRAHGLGRVTQAWQTVAAATGQNPTLRQIVFGADDLLNPVPRLGARDREEAELAAAHRAWDAKHGRAQS